MLPADVRDQMGLAYLFARAADTIADTDLIGREERLRYLNQFRAQFTTGDVRRKDVQAIQAALAPHQTDSAERMLLQRLDELGYRTLLPESLEVTVDAATPASLAA